MSSNPVICKSAGYGLKRDRTRTRNDDFDVLDASELPKVLSDALLVPCIGPAYLKAPDEDSRRVDLGFSMLTHIRRRIHTSGILHRRASKGFEISTGWRLRAFHRSGRLRRVGRHAELGSGRYFQLLSLVFDRLQSCCRVLGFIHNWNVDGRCTRSSDGGQSGGSQFGRWHVTLNKRGQFNALEKMKNRRTLRASRHRPLPPSYPPKTQNQAYCLP